MESSAFAIYIPQNSKERGFSVSSSSYAEPEVMEIDPPMADRSSKRKSKGKQKEVAYHEIIDLDMDEDCNDVVLLEGNFESRKRKKGSMGISLGPSSAGKVDSKEVASNKKGKEILGRSYKGFNPGSNNFFDLDDYVLDDDYSTLQSIGTSNSHLDANLSQPKRVDPSSSTSWFSSNKKNTTVNGPSSKGLSSIESSSSMAKLMDIDVQKRYESFKKFDTVMDHSDHHFANQRSAMEQPPKNWAKKIQKEWKILEKDLPDTIFVRVYESRMDLLRAVIIGAEGTPYHDGLFFFDVCFPSSYPSQPPLVHYHSGGLRINPNLYGCGKVCLSLLNTWSGGRKEKWSPRSSTMLQVLVSIQGLILNMKPYFNEPGFENYSGTAYGEKASLAYNENTLILSLKTMVYTMKNPPKHFEDLVIGHFLLRERDILMACKAYTEGVQVGCLVKGGVQDVDEGSNSCSCSAQFKQNVGSYINTLTTEFKKLGSKEACDFLSSSVK